MCISLRSPTSIRLCAGDFSPYLLQNGSLDRETNERPRTIMTRTTGGEKGKRDKKLDKKVRWVVVVRVQLHLRARVRPHIFERVRKREREERKRGRKRDEAKVEDL